ncbi:hypothetical protein HMPREF1548_02997 [Clostridium sp. KLE 1755]|nr:hypothetical protein HMPREF1548_02997 [Clostridium sp. KLE 1755]
MLKIFVLFKVVLLLFYHGVPGNGRPYFFHRKGSVLLIVLLY